MATYLMFGTINPETTKVISARRTEDAIALVRSYGGEFKARYALLGDVDFVTVLELPGNEAALQVSIGLTRLLGFPFRAAPAISVAEFDALMARPQG